MVYVLCRVTVEKQKTIEPENQTDIELKQVKTNSQMFSHKIPQVHIEANASTSGAERMEQVVVELKDQLQTVQEEHKNNILEHQMAENKAGFSSVSKKTCMHDLQVRKTCSCTCTFITCSPGQAGRGTPPG